jgi:DNA-binding CsgD family transcriptional regulator
MEPIDFEGLSRRGFAAAQDQQLWASLVEDLLPTFRAEGAVFAVLDLDHPDRATVRPIGFRRDLAPAVAEYREVMGAFDPQVAVVADAAPPPVFLGADAIIRDQAEAARFLDWQEARLGTRDFVTGFAEAGTRRVGFSFHCRSANAPDLAEARLLSRIMAVLAPSLALATAQADLLDRAFWDGLTLAGARALVLVGESGRVLRISPAAERCLRRSLPPLRIKGGRIEAAVAECGPALAASLGAAMSRLPRTTRLCLRSEDGGRYPICVQPIGARPELYLAERGAALLVIGDPEERPEATVLGETFGFTARERHVASMLAGGLTTAEIAGDLGISHETVRIHLRALFAKTGTRRQAELVRMMALPPAG